MGYNKASNPSNSQKHFCFDIFFPKQKQDSDNWAAIVLNGLLKTVVSSCVVQGQPHSMACPLTSNSYSTRVCHRARSSRQPSCAGSPPTHSTSQAPFSIGRNYPYSRKRSPAVPIPERFQKPLCFLDSASGVLGALGSVQNPWHYTSLCSMMFWKMRKTQIFLQITFCVWSVETFGVSVQMVSWAWTSSMRSPASRNSFEYSAIANCPLALWTPALCPGTAAELLALLGQLPASSFPSKLSVCFINSSAKKHFHLIPWSALCSSTSEMKSQIFCNLIYH